jgi:glycosyltransferase involved in cell wall biosynthesis
VKVFYTWGEKAKEEVFDPGFGKERKWDIPLLDGYEYEFLFNSSKSPGSHHFRGINNPDLIRKVKSFKADAILVFGWAFQSHLQVIRYFKNKLPVYFRGDSTLLDEPGMFSFKKFARRLFLRWVYSHIDYALYVGTANKEYFLAHGVPEKKLIFAPHAIDNCRFQETLLKNESSISRNEMNIPDESIVFLYAGKFEEKKDPLLLVNAFKQIPEQNIILLLVGSGLLDDKIKYQIRGDTRIKCLPFQNQTVMPHVYNLCDVFVLPSKGPGETWGLAVNEAMACGKAILASTKVGCSGDLVKEGINGYVFNSENVNDLHDKMRLMVNHPKQLLEMGKNSRVIIENYKFEPIVQSVEQCINNSC